jgi:hypothetical protein
MISAWQSKAVEFSMAKRTTDKKNKSWFRSERTFSNDERGYFHTREGTIEGPYRNERVVKNNVKFYTQSVSPGAFPRSKL